MERAPLQAVNGQEVAAAAATSSDPATAKAAPGNPSETQTAVRVAADAAQAASVAEAAVAPPPGAGDMLVDAPAAADAMVVDAPAASNAAAPAATAAADATATISAQAGRKRPAPSSDAAGQHMQRPPTKHSIAAAAAAAAAATAAQEQQQAEQQMEQEGDAEEEDAEDDEEWQMLLYNALSAAAPPPRFACSGRLDKSSLPWLCPEVTVEGVGRLGLPLSVEQAATLKGVAEQAPHGKGLQTVVNTAVRDALQVDARKVSIGSSWQPVLAQAVASVSEQLGLSDSGSAAGSIVIEPRLYKLLLYEQGGHFSAHQDTEKERGMIGTLVVQLPCAQGHTGGVLTVRHKGVSHTHKFEKGSDHTLQYAAFFADCEHELSPIASGRRLVLVYNLVWVGPKGVPPPRLHNRSPAEVQLRAALRVWERQIAAGKARGCIALLLDHKYTEANLDWQHLKGNDRSMAQALATCPGIDAHLVLATRRVCGGAEDSGWGYRNRGRCCYYDDDGSEDEEAAGPHTMIDVYEDEIQIDCWLAPDGAKHNYGNPLADFFDPLNENFIGDDSDPDDEEYEGYTGNTGPTLEHIYYRTLLVLWPRSQSMGCAEAVGLPAVLSVLKRRIADAEAEHTRSNSSSGNDSNDSNGNDSSSKGFSKVAKHLLAALTASVKQLTQPMVTSVPLPQTFGRFASSYFSAYGSGQKSLATMSNHAAVSTVLPLGIQAVQLGVEGAADVLLRLVAAIASSSIDGLQRTTAHARLLAQAAAVLDAAAVAPLVQQLVSGSITIDSKFCLALIAGLQGQPELQQQVVQLLASVMKGDSSGTVACKVAALLPHLAEMPQALQRQLAAAAATSLVSAGPVLHMSSILLLLQQQHAGVEKQLVDAVCAALRNPAALACQASDVAAMLSAVHAHPGLQTQLRAAIVDSIFTNAALLAAQTDASMVALCDIMLLSSDEVQVKHFAAYATAVARRHSSAQLLVTLVEQQQQLLPAALIGQLVDAAVAAVPTATTLQVGDWAKLVSALCRAPALLQQQEGQQAGAVQSADPTASQLMSTQVRRAVTETVLNSGALLAAQTDDSMVQLSELLLAGDQTLQAGDYGRFAVAVSQRPNSWVLLARLLQATPLAAQDQLVAAHATALRAPGSVWQVSQQTYVLGALEGELRKRLESAIAESLFTRQSLRTSQPVDSMLQLSSMLLGNSSLRAAYYDAFAAAAGARQDSYQLLKQLLTSQPVLNALAIPEVQQLVSRQIGNLQRLSTVPAFTWNMPQASVPSSHLYTSSQVQHFLRGPNQQFILRGNFSGIAQARKAASALTGGLSYTNKASAATHSFTAVAAGTGKNAHVVVSKTRDFWNATVAGPAAVFAGELQEVMALKR